VGPAGWIIEPNNAAIGPDECQARLDAGRDRPFDFLVGRFGHA
jgi:hypothetical protein